MQDEIPPRFLRTLRMIYWSSGRKWQRIPHLISVLGSFARNWLILWFRRHFVDRRPPVAIALMDRLGDIVSVEPVGRYARERYPDAPILWFTTAPYASLLSGFRAVDRVVTVRCLTEWMLLWRTGPFRAVLDLHFSGVYCLDCVISFPKPGAAGAITAETHLDYGNLLATRCVCAGIPPITQGPELSPDADTRRKVDELDLPDGFVVIHCAASDVSREWRDENWLGLVDFVADRLGREVVEVGLLPRAVRASGERRRNLCGQLSPVETAEVIRRARLFIGIESGPAHLANAVGTRGIILLGRFRGLERYMVYSGAFETGERARLLWAEGPTCSLPFETVLAAVSRELGAPDGIAGRQRSSEEDARA